MITNSKQVWAVGSPVKLGFMSLVVVAAVATQRDFAPDAYLLMNAAGESAAARIAAVALRKASAPTAIELLFA